ncbi:MAG: hypothetical protein HYW37_01215 [Candidatus Colwellbacteria bacterium]|nr:hypothetical protein [Candidatus Colwellbacteria bacterium]
MAQANQELRITNGPSRWNLMLSLLDEPSISDGAIKRREVIFSVIETAAAGPQEFRGVINKLEREDDLGWRWLFEGTFEVIYGRHIKTSPRKGTGVFDLRSRTGRFSWGGYPDAG